MCGFQALTPPSECRLAFVGVFNQQRKYNGHIRHTFRLCIGLVTKDKFKKTTRLG
jgi:hypothetical protein